MRSSRTRRPLHALMAWRRLLTALVPLLLLVLLPGAAGVARAGTAAPDHQILVMLRMPPRHFRPEADYASAYGSESERGVRRRAALKIAAENALGVSADWPMPEVGVDCYVMDVPEGRDPAAVVDALTHDARVAWAQPMATYRAQGAVQPDPLLASQPAASQWRLTALHEIATGHGVTVAVIDSGVQADHPDLAGQVAQAQNFVDARLTPSQGHGTAVAGIIAARAGNGIGIAGIAPGASLMALQACWQDPETAGRSSDTICSTLTLARALQYAIANHAQVINMSLSGPPDLLLGRLIDVALTRGASVVAAVDPNQVGGGFPAAHRGVIAVTDAAPVTAPAVQAPGHDVPTTLPGGGYGLVQGSSYAAAHVSGLLALLREFGPSAAPASTDASPFVLRPARDIDTCATLLRASGPRAGACSTAIAATNAPLR